MNPKGGKRFSLLQNMHTDSVVHPASYSMARGSFSGIMQLELEVDHSPPPIAEVKNEYSYMSLPLKCLHGMARDNFTYRIRGWVGPRAIKNSWHPLARRLGGLQGHKLSLVPSELGVEWAPGP